MEERTALVARCPGCGAVPAARWSEPRHRKEDVYFRRRYENDGWIVAETTANDARAALGTSGECECPKLTIRGAAQIAEARGVTSCLAAAQAEVKRLVALVDDLGSHFGGPVAERIQEWAKQQKANQKS